MTDAVFGLILQELQPFLQSSLYNDTEEGKQEAKTEESVIEDSITLGTTAQQACQAVTVSTCLAKLKANMSEDFLQHLATSTSLLPLLFTHLDLFNPTSRKDILSICTKTFRHERFKEPLVASLISTNSLSPLVHHLLPSSPIFLDAGNFLREFLRHSEINRIILEDLSLVMVLLSTAQVRRPLDPAWNALEVLKMLLTKFPKVSSPYLLLHFDHYISAFEKLLTSTEQVSKRQVPVTWVIRGY